MIYIDVDTAVTVPANIMPLMDDTDFITREVAIVYNQAGMDLVWNFVTSAGVITQTAVTPTTAGVYDWTHVGDGMYKIEIPASAGGSINNDAEGVGYFTGICTGVLAWRGPDIVFRAAALNDAMIDGGDSLDVNVTAVSGDATAADNLELQYDGTGLTGGTFPSTQDAVGGIGSTGGAALPVEATSDNAGGAIIDSVTILGTEAGTYTNTEADDAAYHVITGTATALDWVYGFVLGGGYVASSLTWKGFVNSSNDDITVQAWNGSTWDTRQVISGVNGSVDEVRTIELLAKHTTAAGLVYLRFVTSGDTNPELHTNVLSVLKVNTSRTVGYEKGAVWVDTVNGVAGTELYTNGVADNPVLTWADALTISAALPVPLKQFEIVNGSSITLSASAANYTIMGSNYAVVLNGQAITDAHIHGATISGIGTGAGPVIMNCIVGDCTIDNNAVFRDCEFTGTLTLGAAGDYVMIDCVAHLIASADSPTIDFAAVGASIVNYRRYSGGLTANNIAAGDILGMECVSGGPIVLNGADGTSALKGSITDYTDNRTGSPILNVQAVLNTTTLATAANLATAQTDLDIVTGTTGAVLDVTADVYHANIQYVFDTPVDEYTVTWFKNGNRITSGITVPTVQVAKRTDGTDLVPAAAMSQIGTTGSYKYDEATNVIVTDEGYVAVVAATIDAGGRTYSCLVSRSS
jgi:hypothetical protein